jgi:hypothetical protein
MHNKISKFQDRKPFADRVIKNNVIAAIVGGRRSLDHALDQ